MSDDNAIARSLGPFVIGTAGHVDHGKTLLVFGLTGVETDRLEEERRRGVTIELGFARWRTAEFEASIVDVPGHEDFVRTMVAGAGGVDILLLVVAADEGVMPQTREHAHICALLGVRRAIVVLTKTDRLDDDESLELALDDVRSELADTLFAEAPIVATALPTEGPSRGLDELGRVVADIARTLEPRGDDGPALLSVDRAFSVRGRGSVATATLLGGQLHTGQQLLHLSLDPKRAESRATVRGLHVRGQAVQTVHAGERVAINLADLELDAIRRGDAFCSGTRAVRSDALVVAARHLAHGPRPWCFDSSVLLCAGGSRAVARLDPLDPKVIAPGGDGLLRIRLDRPIPAWRGLSVVLRELSDTDGVHHFGRTVGGGTVVDPEPQSGRGLRPRWTALGRALAQASLQERVAALIDDAGIHPVGVDTIDRRCCDLATPTLDTARIASIAGPHAVQLPDQTFVAAKTVERLRRQVVAEVHASPGLTAPSIGVSDPAVPPHLVALALARALDGGLLERDAATDRVYPAGRRPLRREALPAPLDAIMARYEAAELTPPTLKELAPAIGIDLAELRTAIGRLSQAGLLVRLSPDLALPVTTRDRLFGAIRSHFAEHPRLDLQAFKAITGVSRKFAVPMLEHLDEIGATLRRRGEQHVRSRGPKLDALGPATP